MTAFRLEGAQESQVHPKDFYAMYLVVNRDVLSFGPEEGESLFDSPGRKIPGERADRACVSVCADDKFDKYVYEAISVIGYPRYCVISFKGTPQYARGEGNCQT